MKDEIGNRYGKLLVLKRAGMDKRGKAAWECRCDCGALTIRTGSAMRKGRFPTRTCGCGKGPGHSKTLPMGAAAFNRLYAMYQQRCPKRNIAFDLDVDEFREITSSNCAYCGAPPSQTITGSRHRGNYKYNGIDRVDNEVGYVYGNMVACCWQCNKSKADMNVQDFISWIRRAASHIEQRPGLSRFSIVWA